jgi:translation initiation factor IF-3|tara:strand:+ start:839 stop:1387 length:549 start_codon:yes stop_codon:yes gene_type:complete
MENSIVRTRQEMPSSSDGPRINEMINSRSVRCIDPDGEQLGILSIDEAMNKAEELGLDLVELQPNADPPVCKILDYGKHKYQAQKRANEARKKQKIIEVKEIKLRPNIDQHDYQVKMKAVRKFIDGGDKVKITLRFRGREMAHVELGTDLLSRVQEDIDDFAKIESMPKMEGRQMTMILAPK